MSRYIELDSAKYFDRTAEAKTVRRYRNRTAIRAFIAFSAGILLLPAAIYVGQHLHEWMPIADAWVREQSNGKYALPTTLDWGALTANIDSVWANVRFK